MSRVLGGDASVAADTADCSHPADLIEALEAAAAEVQNLRIALQTARCIGMAVGIVMARRRISSAQAFDLLRRASQHQHRKVHDVAEDIVYTGALPSADPATRRSRAARAGTSRRI
jgi:hypothetical protein